MEDSTDFIQRMMELGIGMSMIQQMPAMVNACIPPPISNQSAIPLQQSSLSIFVAINGKQTGPFNELEFTKLIQSGIIKSETLVWTKGMSTWKVVSDVPEANKLLIMNNIHKNEN